MTGTFVWYDLMTPEPEAAIAFYTGALGYEAAKGPDGMPYTMLKRGEHTLGGIMPLTEEAKKMGAPPHWNAYVLVDDIDETTTRATGFGGKVLVPASDTPGGGKFAVLADPDGAVFGLFQSKGPPESSVSGGTTVAWHELMTEDLEQGFLYYSALFGWSKGESIEMGEMGTYQMYGFTNQMLGGMMKRPPQMPMAAWLYYFTVDDVDKRVKTIQSLGGKLVSGPMEVPGGDRVATFTDPAGAMFAIHATKAS